MSSKFVSNLKVSATVTLPQEIQWPVRYFPRDLRGKMGIAIIPEGKSLDTMLSTEDSVVLEKLGVEVRSITSSAIPAFFIVKDTDPAWRMDPTNPEYREILKRAGESNLPIYPLSYFHLCERYKELPKEKETTGDSTSAPFVLWEGVDGRGRLTLTQGEDFQRFLSQDEDNAFDELGRQTLIRDPYVQYVSSLSEEEKVQLLQYVVDGPPRVISTRWKAHLVLNEYLASAWELRDNTWTFDFNEELFESEYEQSFAPIRPVVALRASILAFLQKPELYFS